MRMNVYGQALDDPRFTRAGFKLKMHRRDVLGRCIAVWTYCYEQRTDTLSIDDVDGLAEREGFAAALVAVDLAQQKRSRVPKVRLKGTGEYLKWLKGQDARRELALAAKRAMGRPVGRLSDLVSDLDPVPDADLAPEGEQEQQQQVQQTAQLQQQGPPAERSGWSPPAGGLADQEAWRRVAAGEITSADVTACWEYCERQGVPLQRNADERAAKLIAIQKPKRAAKRTNGRSELADDDSDELPAWARGGR